MTTDFVYLDSVVDVYFTPFEVIRDFQRLLYIIIDGKGVGGRGCDRALSKRVEVGEEGFVMIWRHSASGNGKWRN